MRTESKPLLQCGGVYIQGSPVYHIRIKQSALAHKYDKIVLSRIYHPNILVFFNMDSLRNIVDLLSHPIDTYGRNFLTLVRKTTTQLS